MVMFFITNIIVVLNFISSDTDTDICFFHFCFVLAATPAEDAPRLFLGRNYFRNNFSTNMHTHIHPHLPSKFMGRLKFNVRALWECWGWHPLGRLTLCYPSTTRHEKHSALLCAFNSYCSASTLTCSVFPTGLFDMNSR